MKLIVQRVSRASVSVENNIIGQINKGYMVLVGFGEHDSTREADFLSKKLHKLRIFEDEDGRMNLSVNDVDGSILLIPQFTLYGDTNHHNRPSFNHAMKPDEASKLFDYFTNECSKLMNVETGEFGAYMDVSLNNDGPVTIIMEKEYTD